MEPQQAIIDALIDHIDQAIIKGSVTNTQVAAVLDFINERLKSTLRKDTPDTANELITFLKGLKSADIVTLLKGLHVEGGADIDNLHVIENLTAKVVDAVSVSATKAEILTAIVNCLHAREAALFEKGIISKDKSSFDNIEVLDNLVSNILQSSNYTDVGGKGYSLRIDEQGRSTLVVDNIHARMEAIFNKLTISEMQSVGGQIVLSIANMECLKVVSMDGFYRCYFNNQNGAIPNKFAKYDQARCQTFDGAKTKYYWRLVVSVGADYIDLSKTDCDGTGVPESRDSIVQLGNRTDVSRQNAIILSAYGVPSIKQYDNIHSYSLDGCEVTVIGPEGNKFTGDFSVISGEKKVRIPADLGAWNNGMACRYYDRVSHNGALWLCLVAEGTTTSEPSDANLIWAKQVSEGSQGTGGLSLSIYSNRGIAFRQGSTNTTLYAHVTEGGVDISNRIKSYNWYRISADHDADKHWNDAHKAIGQNIIITNQDVCGLATSFEFEPNY